MSAKVLSILALVGLGFGCGAVLNSGYGEFTAAAMASPATGPGDDTAAIAS